MFEKKREYGLLPVCLLSISSQFANKLIKLKHHNS